MRNQGDRNILEETFGG